MRDKSLVQKALTLPGDLGLRFLLWREDRENFLYYLLFPVAVVAHLFMVAADITDDLFDSIK